MDFNKRKKEQQQLAISIVDSHFGKIYFIFTTALLFAFNLKTFAFSLLLLYHFSFFIFTFIVRQIVKIIKNKGYFCFK